MKLFKGIIIVVLILSGIQTHILECRVVTLNPRHDTHFLLCHAYVNIPNNTASENDYLEVLNQIKKYLSDNSIHRNLSYVVEWNKKNKPENTIISHFTGPHLQSVVEKFYFEKDPTDVIVYNIRLVSES